jgi:hypothetical protein
MLWHYAAPFVWAVWSLTGAQAPQNPSPMVEHTRSHERLEKATPEGRRFQLEIGTLFIPEALAGREELPLFVHFHGGTWLPEVAAAKNGKSAVISVQLGAGSSTYGRPFAKPEVFRRLLEEAEAKSDVRFSVVGLTGWSAGYGAVRAILSDKENYNRVSFVMLLDGLHAGYVSGKPGPLESELVSDDLAIFVRFARDAVGGGKQMIVTHSEIFPGTFASTTETTDYLLGQLGLHRTAVLKWGPMGTQQLSEVKKGRFLLLGFAGNSAPDHVDHLHALPEFLGHVEWASVRGLSSP